VNKRGRNPGALSPPAPPAPFYPAHGSTLTDTPPASSIRSPIFGTAFRSPATAAPLDASIPGSTFPACPFESRPASYRPVRLFGSTAPTGSPQSGPLQRQEPVAGNPPPGASLAQRLHSPSGPLRPSGSTCSAPVQPTGPTCRSRPISLRSPPPSSFGLPAADHRSRFATLPEACCSQLSRLQRISPATGTIAIRETAGTLFRAPA
jgi:hypothetical protein